MMTLDDICVDSEALMDPRLIQMAHDLIGKVLTGAVRTSIPLTSDDITLLSHYATVLCWVLGHVEPGGSGERFNRLLQALGDYVICVLRSELGRVN